MVVVTGLKPGQKYSFVVRIVLFLRSRNLTENICECAYMTIILKIPVHCCLYARTK